MLSQKQNKKYHSKTLLDVKNLLFHDVLYHLVFLYFSTARQVAFAVHNKKITGVKGFKAAQPMRG